MERWREEVTLTIYRHQQHSTTSFVIRFSHFSCNSIPNSKSAQPRYKTNCTHTNDVNVRMHARIPAFPTYSSWALYVNVDLLWFGVVVIFNSWLNSTKKFCAYFIIFIFSYISTHPVYPWLMWKRHRNAPNTSNTLAPKIKCIAMWLYRFVCISLTTWIPFSLDAREVLCISKWIIICWIFIVAHSLVPSNFYVE